MGEVVAQHTAPHLTLTGGLQFLLQLGELLLGQVLVAEGLYETIVTVAGAAQHQTERLVVLDIYLHIEIFRVGRDVQTLVDEVEQGLGTVLAEELVPAERTFRRGGTTYHEVLQ